MFFNKIDTVVFRLYNIIKFVICIAIKYKHDNMHVFFLLIYC